MFSFLKKNKYKLIIFSTISPFLLSYSAGFYLFPDLRNNQLELLKALNRTGRIALAGAKMAYIYQKVNKFLQQKN